MRHVETFRKHMGGAELNVAVALARLGHRASWMGKLGQDEFGAEVLAFMRGEGVDVAGVSLAPDSPTGVYFKERKALDKLRVNYYRAGSAASKARLEDFDLDHLLSANVLHLTGITPALSEGCHELTNRIVEAANERGAFLSFDANIRFRLFNNENPRDVLLPLVERADMLFLSDDEADLLLGGHEPKAVAKALASLRAEAVVVHGERRAFVVDADSVTERVSYSVDEVDTVGAGDAFVAGYLSGKLRGWGVDRSLELANACGACAVTVPGDAESMPFEEDAVALLDEVEIAER